MKMAAIQMVSSTSPEANLARARDLVVQAAEAGAELVALPENFAFMGRQDHDKLPLAEPDGEGPIQALLTGLARDLRIVLVGGTLPLRTADPQRVTNTLLVYGTEGQRLARYDKIHLFRYDEVTPQGRKQYDEGVALIAGDDPVACDAVTRSGQALRIGLSICYDLRFPELYRRLMAPPCDLIVVPSAFTWTTGQAHWDLLLRARAVENQCFVLAPAQGGLHDNGRRTWGHSLAVDPWGEVIGRHAEGEGWAMAELDPAVMAAVRARLPALTHRRF